VPVPRQDPFAFLAEVAPVAPDERARLDQGEVVVNVVPADGRSVAVLAAARVTFDAERLIAWIRRIDALKRGAYVDAIERFSDPPRLEDVASLTLDDRDLEDIRRCRPGSCGVKLSASEIDRLRRIASDAGPAWRQAVQAAFRALLVARAAEYRAEGHATVLPYHDKGTPVSPRDEFGRIMDASPFLADGVPRLARHLLEYPHGPEAPPESFLYWAKERLGGRPVVSITHVAMSRGEGSGGPLVVVAGKQVYANHYMTGGLGLTMLLEDPEGSRYLAYLNRSRIDILGGLFGGLVRRIMEGRLRSEAGEAVQALRRRIEAGDPP
jgi:hypothetical protein